MDPAGNHILYAYSPAGKLISVTDQVGNQTSLAYRDDPAHYLSSITTARDPNPDPGIRRAWSRLARTAGQQHPRQDYDLADNREVIADRLGNETTLVFDARGNIVAATDPLGHTFIMTYDANDNETRIVSPSGGVTEYTYDSHGNLRAESNARGGLVSDLRPVQQPTELALPGRSKNQLHVRCRGESTAATDGTGATTRFALDAMGRVDEANQRRGEL